jgi:hypothetical protein
LLAACVGRGDKRGKRVCVFVRARLYCRGCMRQRWHGGFREGRLRRGGSISTISNSPPPPHLPRLPFLFTFRARASGDDKIHNRNSFSLTLSPASRFKSGTVIYVPPRAEAAGGEEQNGGSAGRRQGGGDAGTDMGGTQQEDLVVGSRSWSTPEAGRSGGFKRRPLDRIGCREGEGEGEGEGKGEGGGALGKGGQGWGLLWLTEDAVGQVLCRIPLVLRHIPSAAAVLAVGRCSRRLRKMANCCVVWRAMFAARCVCVYVCVCVYMHGSNIFAQGATPSPRIPLFTFANHNPLRSNRCSLRPRRHTPQPTEAYALTPQSAPPPLTPHPSPLNSDPSARFGETGLGRKWWSMCSP